MICSSQSPLLTTHNTHHNTSIPPARFKPTISGGERPYNHTSDRAATADRQLHLYMYKIQSQTALCYSYIYDILIKQFSKSNINSIHGQPHSQLPSEKFWVRTRIIKQRILEVISNQFAVSTPADSTHILIKIASFRFLLTSNAHITIRSCFQ